MRIGSGTAIALGEKDPDKRLSEILLPSFREGIGIP
jgi:hypothetical protein